MDDSERARINALAIIGWEWDNWAGAKGIEATHATARDALAFFNHLQSEKPERLAFPGAGDAWQIVHSYLLHTDRVID
jgi:hypothetical protein